MSEISQSRINQLNTVRLAKVKPEIAGRAFRMVEMARADGFDLLVTSGFRSIAEQNRLFAQGRTRPGKIVTKARGGESKHNFGDAVDFAVIKNGSITWDVNYYKKTVGRYAATLGLKWGGNWKRFKDYAHVELG